MKKILTKIKKFLTQKSKIIVVLGQTSTGKSDIAVDIAKQFNGEVISADSRQVYRGMDLGSGKITKEEMQGVPHHLLDVADPKEVFDVAQFQELGTEKIKEILNRGNLPIVCGGTGFYIDSLVEGRMLSSVKPNLKLRKELEKKPLGELQELLKEKTKDTKGCHVIPLYSIPRNDKVLRNIDMNNPIRIIRALEIIEELGHIPKTKRKNPYRVLFIGLTLPKRELNERIHRRIIERLGIGMLDEARRLLKKGVSHERLQKLGLEYRYMSKHISGEISYDEMIDQLYRDTVQFAKRQRTWFKKNKKTIWFDSFEDRKNMFNLIEKFIK